MIPRGSHTVESVFEEVRRQTGLRVEPYAMNLRAEVDAGWEGAPVLQVLDDLCRALGRGRPIPPDLEEDRPEEESIPRFQPPLVRIDGDRPPFPSVSHWGPFRAAVGDIVVTEVRSARTASVSVVAHVSVGFRPGVRPLFVEGWEVDEAVDDRGARPSGRIRTGGAGPRGTRSPSMTPSRRGSGEDDGTWEKGRGKSVPPPPPFAGGPAALEAPAPQGVRDAGDGPHARGEGLRGGGDPGVRGAAVTVTRAETKDREFHLDYECSGPFRGLPGFVLLDARGCRIHPHGGSSSGSDGRRECRWILRGADEVAAVRAGAWVGHRVIDVPFEFTDIPLPPEEWAWRSGRWRCSFRPPGTLSTAARGLPPVKTVVLERADRTVWGVLEAVRAQTGFEVELSGAELSRRIVFEAGGRPVLEVLGGLARALGGGTVQVRGMSGDSPGSLEVVVGKEAAPPAAFHWRQFRVEVADVRLTVTRSLGGIGRRADVILRLKAQPGVRPLEVRRFAAEAAVDDAGGAVLVPPEQRALSSMEWDEGEDPDVVVFGERFGRGSGGRGSWDFEVSLWLPSREAGVNVARGRSGGGSLDGYEMNYLLAREAPVASLYVSAFVGIAAIRVPVDLRDIPLPGPKGSSTGP